MAAASAPLAAFGVVLPTPGYLFGAIVFGLAGLAAWRYGRQRERPRTLWLGVALMFFPYLVSNTAWMVVIGVALCIGILTDRG